MEEIASAVPYASWHNSWCRPVKHYTSRRLRGGGIAPWKEERERVKVGACEESELSVRIGAHTQQEVLVIYWPT